MATLLIYDKETRSTPRPIAPARPIYIVETQTLPGLASGLQPAVRQAVPSRPHLAGYNLVGHT